MRLTVLNTPVLAEVVYQHARPALVVGCFSTALLTASVLYGIPVARTGTKLLLERLSPYQNSNRMPVTIVHALLPDLADAAAVRAWSPPSPDAVADSLTPLLHAVGFCMQARAHPRTARRGHRLARRPPGRRHVAVLQTPPPDVAGAARRRARPAGVRAAQPHRAPRGPAGPRLQESRTRMSLHVPPSVDGPGARPEPAPPRAAAELPPERRPQDPAAPAAVRPPTRLRALDGLRLVAALMVCAYHYAGRGGRITTSWGASPSALFPHLAGPFSYGCLGVNIFFVISGFVICMSGWGRSLKDFTISRVTRLYPAYWAALILVTVVFLAAGVPRVPDTDLLTNFTMLQMPAGAQRVLGVCWTLWAEMRFYLLFALAVVLPGATRRRVLVFCAVWTIGALYADSSGEAFLKVALMPQYAPYFVAGMGMYVIHRFGHDAMAWGVVAVGFLLGQRYAVKANVAPAHLHVFHHRSQSG